MYLFFICLMGITGCPPFTLQLATAARSPTGKRKNGYPQRNQLYPTLLLRQLIDAFVLIDLWVPWDGAWCPQPNVLVSQRRGEIVLYGPHGPYPAVDETLLFIVIVLQLIVVSISLNWKIWSHVPPSGDATAVSWTEGQKNASFLTSQPTPHLI